MNTLLPPFLIGLAGSVHCIGMCSPLVMAATGKGRNAIFMNLRYNLGRILTYSIIGSFVGLAGEGLQVAGLQQWVSIIAGITLLAIGILNIRVKMPAYAQEYLFRFSNVLKNLFRGLINNRNAFGSVLLGMINGILPCGMTLIAMAYCVTLAGPSDGFVAMLLFGVGTLPVMVGFTTLAKSILARVKIGYSTLQAGLVIACAMILLARGVWSSEVQAHSKGRDEIIICGTAENR